MKYRGQDMLTPPTVELIRSCLILRPNIVATAQEIFDYWENKGWKTKKGTQVKTLEAAIDVCNSIAVERRRRVERQTLKEKKEKSLFEARETVVLPSNKTIREIKSMREQSSKKLLRNCNKAQRERTPNDPYLRYPDQLEDSRWFAFRKFIFAVRGKKCEICGSEDNLQVHHPQYIPGRKAWEYTCNEVIVLCRDCHSKIHHK